MTTRDAFAVALRVLGVGEILAAVQSLPGWVISDFPSYAGQGDKGLMTLFLLFVAAIGLALVLAADAIAAFLIRRDAKIDLSELLRHPRLLFVCYSKLLAILMFATSAPRIVSQVAKIPAQSAAGGDTIDRLVQWVGRAWPEALSGLVVLVVVAYLLAGAPGLVHLACRSMPDAPDADPAAGTSTGPSTG